MSGPLLVIVHFEIPAPGYIYGQKRIDMPRLNHEKRPDGDNLEKFLNDALNGIIWKDDSNISWLLRSKTMTNAKVGRTTIFVRELSKEFVSYADILKDIQDHIHIDEVA